MKDTEYKEINHGSKAGKPIIQRVRSTPKPYKGKAGMKRWKRSRHITQS